MLRVTKLADYGIIMLTHFAHNEGVSQNARGIARDVKLPLPVVSKVLKILTREGLLVSHRGIKGGYNLARKPEEITVASIIGALEGPIALTECSDEMQGGCSRERKCPMRTNWNRINEAIHGALKEITLAEMMQPIAGLTATVSIQPFDAPWRASSGAKERGHER